MRDPIWLPERFQERHRQYRSGPEGRAGKGVRVSSSPLDRVYAEPTPPPAWRRRLEQLWPQTERAQWLKLRMFPVEHLAVHGRMKHDVWVLYTMTPASLIADPTLLAMLQGPPWWELPPDQQYGRMQIVSSYRWEMFRQYQCLASPFWCLQGHVGGTPMAYTPYEAALLRAHGLPLDVPEPGTQDFAPFDERAVVAIAERDRIRKLGSRFDHLGDPSRAVADVKREEEEAEVLYRSEFVKWFTARMEPNAEFIARHTNKSENVGDFRPATKAEANAADAWKDQYIATGTLPVAIPE